MTRLPNFLRGLRAQLLIPLLVALVLAQVISLALFFSERRLAIRSALGSEIAGRIVNVIQLIEAAPEDLHLSILRSAESPLVRLTLNEDPPASDPASGQVVQIARSIREFLDDNDREIFASIAPARNAGLPHRMAEGSPKWMRDVHRRHHFGAGRPMELLLSVRLSDGRWLGVETLFHRPPLQVAWPSFLAMGLMALATILIVLLAVHRISRPMQALVAGADRLGRGEAPVPVPLEGPSELRQVTEAFNTMQERLTRHVLERTDMLAALGHDLRSPLTALRLRIETLEDQEARDRLAATAEEMQSMVETTLAFAKGVAVNEVSTTVDLRALIGGIVDESGDAERIAIVPGESISVTGRQTALKRALRNIIENAVAYGERASITIENSGAGAQIDVKDNGPGLDQEDLERIFDPFVRLETSRSRDTGGIGLGLSIARAIIHSHGGEITLQNHPDGGLVVRILIPGTETSLA